MWALPRSPHQAGWNSEAGRKLQFDMNLQQEAMKRIKMDGGEADALLNELFAEID